MATVRHRRWWASTARLWPRRSGSAARGTEREQILVVDVADASFMMPLSMEETPPAPPSTGMGSSARSCGRPRLPSSGDRGRSDCPSCRSRGNACCARQALGTSKICRCLFMPFSILLLVCGQTNPLTELSHETLRTTRPCARVCCTSLAYHCLLHHV